VAGCAGGVQVAAPAGGSVDGVLGPADPNPWPARYNQAKLIPKRIHVPHF
jgi:hypothetical protein